MSASSLSYYESDITVTNISPSLLHIMAGKIGIDTARHEQITPLLLCVYDMYLPCVLHPFHALHNYAYCLFQFIFVCMSNDMVNKDYHNRH